MQIWLSATSGYTTTFIQKPTIAKVHSIFAKTINLTIFNQIFALQPQESYLSPLSLLTYCNKNELNQLINSFNLTIGSEFHIEFNLSNCQIYPSQLSSAPRSSTEYLYLQQQAAHLLQHSTKNGLRHLIIDGQADDLIFQAIATRLQQAAQEIKAQQWEAAAQRLASVIGLGIGLTPSGDDFLCGILSVLHYAGLTEHIFFQHLKSAIKQHWQQTNEISRAFLNCALNNHFSQAIILFFAKRQASDLIFLKQQFELIGHSSGMDTLCGIEFMLNLLNNLLLIK